MAKRRRLCNYAHASEEVPQKGAMYQRGQFYIVEDNKRKGDRRRYRVMINDSLLGFGGSLVRVKRFVNDMYKGFPFAEDVGDDMADKVRRFGRRAQMEIRPQFQPAKQKQTSTRRKATRQPTAKKPAGKTAAAKETKPQTMTARERNFVTNQIDRSNTIKNIDAVIDFIEKFKQTPAVRKLYFMATDRKEVLSKRKPKPERFNEAVPTKRTPQQGRLF